MELIRVAAVAVLTIATAAFAQSKGGPKTSTEVRGVAVDASGQTIGPVYPSPGAGTVRAYARVGDAIVYISFAPMMVAGAPRPPDVTKLVPAPSQTVFFSEAPCTGTAYISSSEAEAAGVTPAAVVADGFGGGTIYVGSNGPVVSQSVASALDPTGVCIIHTQRESHIVSTAGARQRPPAPPPDRI